MAWRRWVVSAILVGGLGIVVSLYWWPAASPPVAALVEPSCVNDPEVLSGILSGATLDFVARRDVGAAPDGFARRLS